MATAPIGTRLRALREGRGMSQEELSRALGFENRQTVAQIEAGHRKLSAEELVKAVAAFDVSADYFTNPFLIAGEARFSWRRTDVPLSDLDAFESKAGEWIGAYRVLKVATGGMLSPIAHRLTLTRANSYEEAMQAGEAVAAFLKLGAIPSADLARAMQDQMEILVLMVDAPAGISGAACLLRDLGAVLVNRREPPGRRNYDLAHELFHVLTWDAMPPERLDDGEGSGKIQRRVETMAEKFASAVLMPARLFQNVDGPVTDAGWLNATATALGVSAKALKWRMVDLGRIDRDAARGYDDDLLVNNGMSGTKERDRPPAFGEPYLKVVAAGIAQGELSVRRAAALLDVTVDGLGDLMDRHGVPRPYDL